MYIMRFARRAIMISLTTGLLAEMLSATAGAVENGDSGSRYEASGGHEDDVLTAETSSTEIVVSGDTGGRGDGLEPLDTSWTPPVCWYEPWMTAEEFADAVESMAAQDGRAWRAISINSPAEAFTDIYRDNRSGGWAFNTGSKYAGVGYDNYNLDTKDEGLWWRPVINPNEEDRFGYWDECQEPIFWGDPVAEPDLENAVTDEVLAEYAYDEIAIPETEIQLNPEGEQLLGVPTWIWLDGTDFQPRTVRAELPINGLWAETTATPVSLTIDPGTEDAELFPSDGECEIDENGRMGEPYEPGRAEEDPPCGLTYLRATHAVDSFELTASLTWEVHWTGSQTPGENPLPSGTFETSHPIVVNESQTVVVP